MACRAHRIAVAGIEYRTATGGDDLALPRQSVRKYPRFARAEAGFAFAGEDCRDRQAGIRFDPRVDIDKNQPQPRRQQAADMALARAHRTDQDDVAAVGGGMAHRNMLAAAVGPAAMTARN